MTSGQGDAPDDEFVEALVELQADASVGDLVPWCSRHGIDVLPMTAGALLTGSSRRFAEAFGVAHLESRSRPRTLAVPPALANTARSVTVLSAPTPGARDRQP
ncbi:hypothetical protein AQJ84_07375 [Streptomyces resistomycificus]|uniref:Uncharacterized protein n=1 Tax=Streptomyces resistomycificus TaxID=67356 RepID=A0A0L8KT16_9ACTN|nr:hypothetical protein ADK37_38030 [Streptomyces resistomycificus]KUO00802.1 hypothetical protein AQJ84_07375 [Streptomyces resistomycificus]